VPGDSLVMVVDIRFKSVLPSAGGRPMLKLRRHSAVRPAVAGKRNQSHLTDKYIRRWHRAALEKIHAVQALPEVPRLIGRIVPIEGHEKLAHPDKRS
jgi:hypothetical protein